MAKRPTLSIPRKAKHKRLNNPIKIKEGNYVLHIAVFIYFLMYSLSLSLL